jgi:hypothetical protein
MLRLDAGVDLWFDGLMNPGEWRKPEPGEHRAPCPALNSLANGGHIPRDGKATKAQLVRAIEEQFGLSPAIGSKLADQAMSKHGKPGPDGVPVLCLSDLAEHGFIEHDASLTRRDARNGDAVEIVEPLIDQLVSLSKDGKTLTLEDMAVAHQLRMAQSADGGHAVPLKAAVLGAFEASLLYIVLARDGAIAIPDLVEFLKHERIPAHLSPRPIGVGAIVEATAVLTLTGNVPLCEANKRARKAAREMIEPEASRCPVGHKAP